MKFRSIGILSITLISILSILSSCQLQSADENSPANLDTEEIHTFVFSSKNKQDDERIYYDALLALQKKYPNKLDSIKVIQKSNDHLIRRYKVSIFPTIIVLNGKEEIARLEGKRKVSVIQKHLEKAYSN
ncbi:hypothetical protein [Pseudalkalibacillus berkeleyi]|uniref:Small peptidoglycan-associated lipoprotein n=1 Tax=Pseudalkalibacillus berkeleyi TaxID=1069813 RepID=A0ABS9GZM4_9BACL|nr:hypothetical protein [Pseudalkalibacillus berkeleyi]MCF6136943.1 hypothetical protein [Pseudalkalibacillus berkeleyi]